MGYHLTAGPLAGEEKFCLHAVYCFNNLSKDFSKLTVVKSEIDICSMVTFVTSLIMFLEFYHGCCIFFFREKILSLVIIKMPGGYNVHEDKYNDTTEGETLPQVVELKCGDLWSLGGGKSHTGSGYCHRIVPRE